MKSIELYMSVDEFQKLGARELRTLGENPDKFDEDWWVHMLGCYSSFAHRNLRRSIAYYVRTKLKDERAKDAV